MARTMAELEPSSKLWIRGVGAAESDRGARHFVAADVRRLHSRRRKAEGRRQKSVRASLRRLLLVMRGSRGERSPGPIRLAARGFPPWLVRFMEPRCALLAWALWVFLLGGFETTAGAAQRTEAVLLGFEGQVFVSRGNS